MVIQDISDQFASVARSLRNEPNELETLERAIKVVTEVVGGCDYAGITLVRDRVLADTPAATSEAARLSDQLQFELGEGPVHDVVRETEAIICLDTLTEPRWPSWSLRVAQDLGVRSVLCLQLFTTARALGALSLYSDSADAFDAQDCATGLAFAAHLAVAVSSSRDIDGRGQALMNRTTIGQAEGILMERYNLSPEEAFTFLKRVSQDTNTKLTEVALELVSSRRTPMPTTSSATRRTRRLSSSNRRS